MDTDRFDAMLDAALETGAIPPDANASERAEIEAMLASAGQLRTAGADAASEARAAMPIARARFERFLATERAAALPAPAIAVASPKSGFFSRVITGHRTLSVGTMAVLAVLVVGGLLGSRALLGDVETASALVPGDYAQVEGVVTGERRLPGEQPVEHAPDGVVNAEVDEPEQHRSGIRGIARGRNQLLQNDEARQADDDD